MNTDGKKYKIEIPSIGEDIFRNQFGDMGNSRKHSKQKNKPSLLSEIYKDRNICSHNQQQQRKKYLSF